MPIPPVMDGGLLSDAALEASTQHAGFVLLPLPTAPYQTTTRNRARAWPRTCAPMQKFPALGFQGAAPLVGVQGAKPPWAGAGRSARIPNPRDSGTTGSATDGAEETGRSARLPNPPRQESKRGASPLICCSYNPHFGPRFYGWVWAYTHTDNTYRRGAVYVESFVRLCARCASAVHE
jgi:hypothetical protein